MTDAQYSHLDVVRSSLIEQNDEFRDLVSQHHTLDEQLRHLATVTHPTHQQQLEEMALKKHKLVLKDRIEAIVRRHRPSGPSSTH